jgi:hypothetical protein
MGIYWECTQGKRVTRHGSQIELALVLLVVEGMHTHAFGREHHAASVHDYSVLDLDDTIYSLAIPFKITNNNNYHNPYTEHNQCASN